MEPPQDTTVRGGNEPFEQEDNRHLRRVEARRRRLQDRRDRAERAALLVRREAARAAAAGNR